MAPFLAMALMMGSVGSMMGCVAQTGPEAGESEEATPTHEETLSEQGLSGVGQKKQDQGSGSAAAPQPSPWEPNENVGTPEQTATATGGPTVAPQPSPWIPETQGAASSVATAAVSTATSGNAGGGSR
jgi:hypothetical protein